MTMNTHESRLQWVRVRSAEQGTPCLLCDGAGELWQSGRMVACICDNVTTALARTTEQLADAIEDAELAAREAARPELLAEIESKINHMRLQLDPLATVAEVFEALDGVIALLKDGDAV